MSQEEELQSVFEAHIVNLRKYTEGTLAGEWVSFPTTTEKIQNAFKRIGIDKEHEEIFITQYDSQLSGITDALSEFANLSELNYLAHNLSNMSDEERRNYQAALVISDCTGSLKDLINLTENLGKYEVYPSIETQTELGRSMIENSDIEIPKEIRDYIDYEAYGRDTWLNEIGEFTDYGYVRDNQSTFEEVYDGKIENIPEEFALDTKIPEQNQNRQKSTEDVKPVHRPKRAKAI